MRVHQGLPATPLPMRRPAAPAAAPAPVPVPPTGSVGAASGNVAPQPVPSAQEPDLVERILKDVLGGLLGRNN